MKKILSILLAIALVVLSLPLGAFSFTANALTSGNYTYEVSGDKAIITGVDKQISGNVTIPENFGDYPVVEIGDRAFYECKNITEIIVPDGVENIGDGAFALCENLEKVTLPNGINAINKGVFSDCIKLNSINIPDSVVSIGQIAFCNCDALAEITIPQGVTTIGDFAFDGCESLIAIAIPDSVISVGEGTFNNCLRLTDISIGSGIDEISNQMFYGCKAITDIIIPDNIKTIGNSAFDDCANLTTLQLSRNVQTIKSYAFNGCNELTDVWYSGNEADKENILIELYNVPLTDADWHFDLCEPDEHDYDGDCLAGCINCGWTPSHHVYSGEYDESCDECGKTRALPFWQIEADNGTGVYDITPNKALSGFNKDKITIYDKQGNTVKYNDAKKGWPLVKDLIYVVELNGEYDNFDSISWKLTKRASTIFPDTNKSDWYNDAVTYAVGAGTISGYSNGKFGTTDSIQRQDFLVMLARLDGADLTKYTENSTFSDVGRNGYYKAAVNWGAENGIVTGYNNGKFGVGDKVTREQLVTFLYRYAKYKGYDSGYSSNRESVVSTQYGDYKKVSAFAKEPILWAIEKGVINGKTPTTIVPQGNAQRCEVAQIMYNIFLNDIFYNN